MVGKVDYDETRWDTSPRGSRADWIDCTWITRASKSSKGDHMVYIYSEELYSAQEELIQALKFQRESTAARLDWASRHQSRWNRLARNCGCWA